MDIYNEIASMVSEIVGINVLDKYNGDSQFMEDMGLDSLRALEILAAIENKFEITVDPERLQEMTSLNNVVTITKEYIDSQSIVGN